ncbi:MAG: carboxypeptidase-like regulatory protein, partial [Flavipsychrobacter sp.]|nr:carboxypeptidase-like regulatory protein [Flavipsychrobacter sp.]
DPNGFGMSELPPIITFYANNACQWQNISPRGFVSPISDNALHYYNYKYEGEFREGKYTINKIQVIPKRDYEPLLQGTLYIVEDDWAIHSLDLLATTKSNLEVLDTLRFQQVFLPLKKDTWVIKSQVLYPTVKFFGLDIAGYMATVYNKQKVNEPMPDTIFNNKITSVYEKDANKKDTSYWTDKRPIPLETDEVRD